MSDAPEARGAHAPGGVGEARAALLAWVDEAGERGRTFLQIHLRATQGGRYRVRHAADAALPAGALRPHDDPLDARELAQTTDAGEHRPLKTAPNLRRGWSFEALDAGALWTVVDYLYPACAVHWHAARRGTLRVTHWRETAARQSGIYSAVGLLAEPAVRNTVRACCGDAVCLRRVAWGMDGSGGAMEADGAGALGMRPADAPPPGDAVVPCPEACSMFISFARKVLTLERAPRQEMAGLGALGPAEVEQIREVVAAAAAGTLGAAREGDFAEPTNQRRVRYLAARLAEVRADAPGEELPCEGCPRPVPCHGCPLV